MEVMTTPGHLELPRPWRLLLTVGWNLAESLGLPVLGYPVSYTHLTLPTTERV